jgi:hypothetical protein
MTLALIGMMPTQELAVNTTLILSSLPITAAHAWVMDGMDLVTATDMATALVTTLMAEVKEVKVVKEEMVVQLSLLQSSTMAAPMMIPLPTHTMTLALSGTMLTQIPAVNTTLIHSLLPITAALAWVMDGMDQAIATVMAMVSATVDLEVKEKVVQLLPQLSFTMDAPMMTALPIHMMTLAQSGMMPTQELVVNTTLILSFLPITVALAWVMDGMDLAIATDMATASVTTLMVEVKVVKEEMVVQLSLLPSSTTAVPMTTALLIHTMTLALSGMMPTQIPVVTTTLILSKLLLHAALAWVGVGMDLAIATDMATVSDTVVVKVKVRAVSLLSQHQRLSMMAAPMMTPLETRTMIPALNGMMLILDLAEITTPKLSSLPISAAPVLVLKRRLLSLRLLSQRLLSQRLLSQRLKNQSQLFTMAAPMMTPLETRMMIPALSGMTPIQIHAETMTPKLSSLPIFAAPVSELKRRLLSQSQKLKSQSQLSMMAALMMTLLETLMTIPAQNGMIPTQTLAEIMILKLSLPPISAALVLELKKSLKQSLLLLLQSQKLQCQLLVKLPKLRMMRAAAIVSAKAEVAHLHLLDVRIINTCLLTTPPVLLANQPRDKS